MLRRTWHQVKEAMRRFRAASLPVNPSSALRLCGPSHFSIKNNWLWMQNDQFDTFPLSAMVNARPKEPRCLFAFEMIKI